MRRGTIGRAVEAMDDASEIFECYQRIERLLGRVSVSMLQVLIDAVLSVLKFNANISIWKTVDEEAMVRAADLKESRLNNCIYIYRNVV